jgi:serpin B
MLHRWSRFGILGALILLLVVAGPNLGESADCPEPDMIRDRVADNNEFAFSLYQKIAGAETNMGKNVIFSPYSISTALGMTYAGARGETAQQMAAALRFETDQESLHRSFRDLAARVDGTGKPYQLKIANALWGQRNYPFEAKFLSLIGEYYAGGFQTLDFAQAPEPGRVTINQWVERQTADKIRNLLQPGDITSLTRLVLTNAIYFKGEWETAFEKNQTRPAPFKVNPGNTVEVPMMVRIGQLPYAETDSLQAVELPYAGKDLAMVLLLPKDDLGSLEQYLSRQQVGILLTQMQPTRLSLFLPRFKFDARYALQNKEYLPALGMVDAFDSQKADFSGLTGYKDLYISGVFHKAFIDVNESGTEAAAATAVVVGLKSMPPPVTVFRADHPFIFLIHHKPTGSILFMGRIANPAQ